MNAFLYTAHLADNDRPNLTACGEPWQDWQHPDRGASLEEVLAVPGFTHVRQCQACLKRALGRWSPAPTPEQPEVTDAMLKAGAAALERLTAGVIDWGGPPLVETRAILQAALGAVR